MKLVVVLAFVSGARADPWTAAHAKTLQDHGDLIKAHEATITSLQETLKNVQDRLSRLDGGSSRFTEAVDEMSPGFAPDRSLLVSRVPSTDQITTISSGSVATGLLKAGKEHGQPRRYRTMM